MAGESIGKFDETEYVFIGEIVGYTQPVQSRRLMQDAYGLVVKIKENVFLPKTPKTHFELFPIELWADCSFAGTRLDNLKKDFPLNAEIRVIAKEAEILPNNSTDGNIRLEDRPNEISSIALNVDDYKTRMTFANSVFDYASYKYDDNKDSISKYLLPNFEIRKDLLRLNKAKNHEEVTKILDRLLFAPVFSDLNFDELFKNFTLTEVEYNAYFETHLKMTDLETYEQYKIYHGTLLELIKLGYERKTAEEAIFEAIKQGTEIEQQKLLEKSLQILRKK